MEPTVLVPHRFLRRRRVWRGQDHSAQRAPSAGATAPRTSDGTRPLPAGLGVPQAEVDTVQALVSAGAIAAFVPTLRMAHALKKQAEEPPQTGPVPPGPRVSMPQPGRLRRERWTARPQPPGRPDVVLGPASKFGFPREGRRVATWVLRVWEAADAACPTGTGRKGGAGDRQAGLPASGPGQGWPPSATSFPASCPVTLSDGPPVSCPKSPTSPPPI